MSTRFVVSLTAPDARLQVHTRSGGDGFWVRVEVDDPHVHRSYLGSAAQAEGFCAVVVQEMHALPKDDGGDFVVRWTHDGVEKELVRCSSRSDAPALEHLLRRFESLVFEVTGGEFPRAHRPPPQRVHPDAAAIRDLVARMQTARFTIDDAMTWAKRAGLRAEFRPARAGEPEVDLACVWFDAPWDDIVLEDTFGYPKLRMLGTAFRERIYACGEAPSGFGCDVCAKGTRGPTHQLWIRRNRLSR